MSLEPTTIVPIKYHPRDSIQKCLLRMKLTEVYIFDHRAFYCEGWGQNCSLSHFASQLKRRGKGEWHIKHLDIPGTAKVTRIL